MENLKIVYININELKAYENNPRNNEEAISYVKNSIKEFGFKVPCIIDKNNEIVCGHTRVLAAKELKLEQVPCIIADDLSDEQIKAFRLADNKVSEIATWDFELLSEELNNILDIDMGEFGFDFNIEEIEPEELEREEEKKDDKFIVKVTFDTYQDWLDKEDEFRKLVENSNANMVVGSV